MTNNELYHFGIKGQKWGVRRFENEDGTLTSAGKARYDREEYEKSSRDSAKQAKKDYYSDSTNLDKRDEYVKKAGSAMNQASKRLFMDEKALDADYKRTVGAGKTGFMRRTGSELLGGYGTAIRDTGHGLKLGAVTSAIAGGAAYLATRDFETAKRAAINGAAVGTFAGAGYRSVKRLITGGKYMGQAAKDIYGK